jgi:hypothetical protein
MFGDKEHLKKHKEHLRYDDYEEDEFTPRKTKQYREDKLSRRKGRYMPLDDDHKMMRLLKHTGRVRDLLKAAD